MAEQIAENAKNVEDLRMDIAYRIKSFLMACN